MKQKNLLSNFDTYSLREVTEEEYDGVFFIISNMETHAIDSKPESIEQVIERLTNNGVISEGDLHAIAIMTQHQSLEDLKRTMKIIGGFLQAQPDPWLREIGGSVYQAASAKVAHQHELHHSIPDEDTTTVIIDTSERAFHNSLILEKDEEVLARGEDYPPTYDPSDLEHSGMFEYEEPNTLLPISFEDPRIMTLEKLRKGVLHEIDERVRSSKTITLLDMSREWDSSLERQAEHIRQHHIDDDSQLHLVILSSLDEIKALINELLQSTYNELRIRWDGQNTEFHRRFFTENANSIDSILTFDTVISHLKSQAEEAKEMMIEKTFLQEMLMDASKEYEAWKKRAKEKPVPDIIMSAIQNGVLSRIKSLIHHEEERQRQLSELQASFGEFFQRLLKLRISIPDPWK